MITFYRDEKIIKTTRRHSLALRIELFFLTIAALLPLAFYKLDMVFFNGGQPPPALGLLFVLFGYYFIWLTFILILAAVAVSDHFLDMWIITNKRIINIHQTGVFSRVIDFVEKNQIAQIIPKPQNRIERKFDYGTLNIVKSDGTHFKIEEVPHFRKIRHFI